MDRIDLFRIFIRVVETSSFTRTADMLNMPRSTVSTAIRDLEIRTGTRLLARTTRAVSPTQDGKKLYEHCLRLIADVEDIDTLFRKERDGLAGILRVNLPGRIGRLIVAPALPDFLSRHPDLSIELGMTDRAINLVEEQTDCVLRVGPLQDSGLISHKIGELHLLNVASPDYLERYGVPTDPHDLTSHHVIRYASPVTGRVEPWEWMENGESRSILPPACVTVDNAEALIACCLAGMGLIQIPSYDVQQHLQNGELVSVMPEWCAEPLPMSILYPHRHHTTNRVTTFVKWLEILLKRHVLPD
ncbi:transcriptional regulator [Gluconobacter oxydans]|uniref:LysR family transcriptional regulator n=1 Tax=Gluconobacter thailandicus TaxID=257438 RepID=UPI00029990E1|nr:LysR family transcriptional regulator [Gluconobacter thailandicus]AFW00749.1 LysR family transcriptional regulator [Gluconobacter oxydans H24]ANQ40562.1 transcriptional regulator [Gluconobacter oxydans]